MDQYHPRYRCIVTHVLLAARTEIMCRWKSMDVPTLKDIKIKLDTIIEYERILAHRDGNSHKFEENGLHGNPFFIPFFNSFHIYLEYSK